MKKLCLQNDDGESVDLTENPAHIRGVLRWLASRGDPELQALCSPIADECAREEKQGGRVLRQVKRDEQARAGERTFGEPCVILRAGKLSLAEYKHGDEITPTEIESCLGFTYNAAQQALVRGKKEGSFVGVLLKDDPEEVRFCRVSDMPFMLEKFPEATKAWHYKQLSPERRKIEDLKELAALREGAQ